MGHIYTGEKKKDLLLIDFAVLDFYYLDEWFGKQEIFCFRTPVSIYIEHKSKLDLLNIDFRFIYPCNWQTSLSLIRDCHRSRPCHLTEIYGFALLFRKKQWLDCLVETVLSPSFSKYSI